MLGGGGGIGVPSSRSATQTPRFTGEVCVPLAVTFRRPTASRGRRTA